MQTWLVHMRAPRRLLRDLGLPAFLTFQLMVGGNALAALVHPLFIVWFVSALASDGPLWATHGTAALFGFTVVIGYVASALLAWVGLFRRGLLRTSWVLLLMPVHWLLLSLAAWRALYQLVREPYRWEKTDHGLARTSRRARQWTAFVAAPGLTPAEHGHYGSQQLPVRDGAANRPRPPRVSA